MTNIEISKDTYEKFEETVVTILTWCEGLNSLDTQDVEPMYSVFDLFHEGLQNFREDNVSDGNMQEEILANCPDKEDAFICVPKVIEEN